MKYTAIALIVAHATIGCSSANFKSKSGAQKNRLPLRSSKIQRSPLTRIRRFRALALDILQTLADQSTGIPLMTGTMPERQMELILAVDSPIALPMLWVGLSLLKTRRVEFFRQHRDQYSIREDARNKVPDRDGSFPKIAKVGAPNTAYHCTDCSPTADGVKRDHASRVGQAFLTDDGILNNPTSPPMIVEFSYPVQEASGDILDLDGNELWIIQAKDKTGTVIAERTYGGHDKGDGIAERWKSARRRLTSIKSDSPAQSPTVGLAWV